MFHILTLREKEKNYTKKPLGEFYFAKRFMGMKPEMVFTQINTTLKQISEKGFEAERLDKAGIKRLLGIYFCSTMDGDKLPDVDGGQYGQEAADGTV